MGYDISLVDFNGHPVKVERHNEGGVMISGGNTDAMISVTYNYSKYFYDTIDEQSGIRWLYDRPAGSCIDVLQDAVDVLGTCRCDDYWEGTPGNAGHVLKILWGWAMRYPNAIFVGE